MRQPYLEMQVDERKDHGLEVLHEKVKDLETLGVFAALDVDERTDL